jgi:hypothetical protein
MQGGFFSGKNGLAEMGIRVGDMRAALFFFARRVLEEADNG